MDLDSSLNPLVNDSEGVAANASSDKPDMQLFSLAAVMLQR